MKKNKYETGEINRFIEDLVIDYNPGFDYGNAGTEGNPPDHFNLDEFLSEINETLTPQTVRFGSDPEYTEYSQYEGFDAEQDWSTIHALQGVKYAPEYVDAAFGSDVLSADCPDYPDVNIYPADQSTAGSKIWKSVKSIVFGCLFCP